MGQADWNDLQDSTSIATLARGVTAGITGPNGGNGFVFGYNSLDGTVTGAHGKFVDLTNFAPTGSGLSVPDGGGSVRGCVRRVASPNSTGFTPFLFFALQGTNPPSINDQAYMLGLSDSDPYEIVLAKAVIVSGIAELESNTTVLRRSSSQFSIGDGLWHHLRLDVIVQPNGDVLLKCFESDLVTNPISGAADWQPISGMSDYIDDAIQINTGSAPLWGGFAGFAFSFANGLNRRGAFDALEVYRTS